MKKIALLFLPIIFLTFSGCALLLLGGAGAAGYSLSGDSAEGIVNASYDKTWNAATTVFSKEGVILIQDKNVGRLEALVGGIKMKAQLDRMGKSAIRLKISGRKNLLPKAKQAGEVYTKILQKV